MAKWLSSESRVAGWSIYLNGRFRRQRCATLFINVLYALDNSLHFLNSTPNLLFTSNMKTLDVALALALLPVLGMASPATSSTYALIAST